MTKLKTKIEDKTSLSRFAKIIGLDEFIIISKQNELNGIGRSNEKILEDAFESFMGAVYKDSGFYKSKEFIEYILENEIDWSEIINNDKNYKDQLLRYYHSNKWSHPKYIHLEEYGYGNKKTFKVGLLDNNNNIIVTAKDSSKQKAEQKVSLYGLYKFNQLTNDQISNIDELELLN